MKGSLHTDELMSAVVSSATGLRTSRRISHAFVMSVPTYPKPLVITDAAINIAPTLEEKRDICQNAIDLAHSLGCVDTQGRHPFGCGNGDGEDPFDDRRGGAVQDGRSGADHWRNTRWSVGHGQCHQCDSSQDQGHCL